jgi:hypothetical protein
MEGKMIAAPYDWPHDASFSPENTALVIIDMQRDCKSQTSHFTHQFFGLESRLDPCMRHLNDLTSH